MIPVDFPGGIDIVPGTQTEPVAPGGFRLVTVGGVPNVTTDGAAFTSLAPAVPATSSTAGLMTAAQFVALQNVGEYHIDVDMTGTGDKGVIVPARVGQVFIVTRASQFVNSATGTASGTAPTVSLGIPGAFTNVLGATAIQSVASINSGAGSWSSASVAGNGTAPLTTNTAIHAAVGTAVTGASALSVRISVFGYWTAL